MAAKSPDNADVFQAAEALPYLAGKQATFRADVFVRGESFLAMLAQAVTARLRMLMGFGT